MKKVLVAAFVLTSIINSANAQKNTLLVGGDLGLSSVKNNNNEVKESEFKFNPFVGYQFNDNWTAGIKASLTSAKETEPDEDDNKSSLFAVGPFVRYTHTLSNTFSVFGQLEGGFGSQKINGTKVASVTGINLFPALFINFKNSFGLNFDFGGVTYGSYKPEGGKSINSFNLNFGKTINIGISKNFSFDKKK